MPPHGLTTNIPQDSTYANECCYYHTINKRWMLHKGLEKLNFEPRLLCLRPSFIVSPQEIEEVYLATSSTTKITAFMALLHPKHITYSLVWPMLSRVFLQTEWHASLPFGPEKEIQNTVMRIDTHCKEKETST